MGQSQDVYHVFANQDMHYLICDTDFDIRLDDRDKIEDLNNFKRYMKARNLWTEELENETELYLKFHNN